MGKQIPNGFGGTPSRVPGHPRRSPRLLDRWPVQDDPDSVSFFDITGQRFRRTHVERLYATNPTAMVSSITKFTRALTARIPIYGLLRSFLFANGPGNNGQYWNLFSNQSDDASTNISALPAGDVLLIGPSDVGVVNIAGAPSWPLGAATPLLAGFEFSVLLPRPPFRLGVVSYQGSAVAVPLSGIFRVEELEPVD